MDSLTRKILVDQLQLLSNVSLNNTCTHEDLSNLSQAIAEIARLLCDS